MDYLDDNDIKIMDILRLQLIMKANLTHNKIIEYHKIIVMLKQLEYLIEHTKLDIMTIQATISIYQNQKQLEEQQLISTTAYKAYEIVLNYLNKQLSISFD
jgi:hypothetical protein